MLERFTQSARGAVTVAREEARRVQAPGIEAVHLLTALAAEPETPAGRVLQRAGLTAEAVRTRAGGPLDPDALATLGIDLAQVRSRVEEAFGEGALERGRRLPGRIPVAPSLKAVLAQSVRSAASRGDNFIGSEHLLLGIVEVKDTGVDRVLDGLGASRAALQTAIRAELSDRRAG